MKEYVDRVNHLQLICGLEVHHRIEKNENVFEFLYDGRTIKTCFTYAKAKCFAEGVSFGNKVR